MTHRCTHYLYILTVLLLLFGWLSGYCATYVRVSGSRGGFIVSSPGLGIAIIYWYLVYTSRAAQLFIRLWYYYHNRLYADDLRHPTSSTPNEYSTRGGYLYYYSFGRGCSLVVCVHVWVKGDGWAGGARLRMHLYTTRRASRVSIGRSTG